MCDLVNSKQGTACIGQLEGMLMISPGVGLDLENYMERVQPGSVKRLRDGDAILHPSADPEVHITGAS